MANSCIEGAVSMSLYSSVDDSCFIGVKDSKGIRGIYCETYGYLEEVGIRLYLFYNTEYRIDKLLSNGDIICLGRHPTLPNLPYQSMADIEMCHSVNKNLKSDFTVSACLPKYGRVTRVENIKGIFDVFPKTDYIYLFDLKDSTWYLYMLMGHYSIKVCGEHGAEHIDELPCHNLSKLFHFDPDAVEKYTQDAQGSREAESVLYIGQSIHTALEKMKKVCSMSDIETCNHWLNRYYGNNGLCIGPVKDGRDLLNPIVGVEIGVSETKEDGKSYAIFKRLEDGESKRKCLMRSKNLNDLTLAICHQYGIDPFARPIFSMKSVLK